MAFFFILILSGLIFAQNSEVINDFILRQDYQSAQKICENLKNPDSLFFISVIEYSILVDYESYETENGKKTLITCEKAIAENVNVKDSVLYLYRAATLNGMLSTIYIKRGNFFQGIAKMSESQKNWGKLLNFQFANEANFALALVEYYRITLFNKSPKNQEKLNAVLEKIRKTVEENDEKKLYLSLSYIWVLQEQKLWKESDKILENFFEKYPENTMMLRAKQTILTDKKEIEEVKTLSKKLYDLSAARTPQNYSDMMSARRALVSALYFENKKDEACKTANSTVIEYQNIPVEIKKTYWVKKHYETIKKYSARCEK